MQDKHLRKNLDTESRELVHIQEMEAQKCLLRAEMTFQLGRELVLLQYHSVLSSANMIVQWQTALMAVLVLGTFAVIDMRCRRMG